MVKDIKKAKDIKKNKESKEKQNKQKSKKDSKKSSKKSSKKENNPHKKVVKESVSKRKWNEKDLKTGEKKIYKKGTITEEEAKKIENSLCEYAFQHNYSEEQLLSIITEKLTNDNKIWPEIAECLPERSVQSVHNFCHRKYHPNNYKGYWTSQEEKDLINLVKEHGKKWTLIASES